MVPAFQPYLSMQFVNNYIESGHLSCETEADGKCRSIAKAMCGYMDDCSGNG